MVFPCISLLKPAVKRLLACSLGPKSRSRSIQCSSGRALERPKKSLDITAATTCTQQQLLALESRAKGLTSCWRSPRRQAQSPPSEASRHVALSPGLLHRAQGEQLAHGIDETQGQHLQHLEAIQVLRNQPSGQGRALEQGGEAQLQGDGEEREGELKRIVHQDHGGWAEGIRRSDLLSAPLKRRRVCRSSWPFAKSSCSEAVLERSRSIG